MYFAADHETRNDNEESSAIYDIKALRVSNSCFNIWEYSNIVTPQG